MTIYDYLGINDDDLLNVEIPIKTILDNINNITLRWEAEELFDEIKDIKLKLSINRNEHYLQVLEINMKSAVNIERIAFIIQKTIKYRILFVFNYQDKNLLLWRSFKMTKSTENVYTNNTTRCTNWIYNEYLVTDAFYQCNVKMVESIYDMDVFLNTVSNDRENGDFVYFTDVLNNVVKINNCLVNADIISARFLLDWLSYHNIGGRVGILELLDILVEKEACIFIDGHLFFEKDQVNYAIESLSKTRYSYNVSFTGKNPMTYFEVIGESSTFDSEDDLICRINLLNSSNEKTSNICFREGIPYLEYNVFENENLVEDKGIFVNELYDSGKTAFVDDIIRRHRLKGYFIVEDQNRFNPKTIKEIRELGWQVLEQFEKETFESIYELSTYAKIDLIYRLAEKGLKLKDCPSENYNDIEHYLHKKIKCKDCGNDIESNDWEFSKLLCNDCFERHKRIKGQRKIDLYVDDIEKDWLTYYGSNRTDLIIKCSLFSGYDSDTNFEIMENYIVVDGRKISLFCTDDLVEAPVDYDGEFSLSRLFWKSQLEYSDISDFVIKLKKIDETNEYVFHFKIKNNSMAKLYDCRVFKRDNYAEKIKRCSNIPEYNILPFSDEWLEEQKARRKKLENTLTLSELDFSVRTYNVMNKNGFSYLRDILSCGKANLLKLNGVTLKVYEEVVSTIERWGFKFYS